MPTKDSSKASKRKLVAILFADIVGYTAMMQADEGSAMSRLRHYQRVLLIEGNQYNGQIIKNYGDGSLCVFTSVLDAVNCAKAIQEALSKEPQVPLRIGLHLGDIMYEGDDIYGNALNIASRIESMGIAGGVLLSNDIYRKVKNQADLQFKSLSSFKFKNVEEPMEIYALSNPGMKVPRPDQIKGKVIKSSNTIWPKVLMIAVVLGLMAISYMYFIRDNSNGLSANRQVSKSSIAVLPFDNMSADPANEFFTNGMHDGLLTHLSKISGMKVISRTSVKQYKDTEKSIPLIARELSVANILEGSVQRSGDQVRVNVQLIDGVTDEHLWSKIYDKQVTTENIFDLQTEIVSAIAAELETTISLAQQNILAERPTNNLEAYEAYLRARQLKEVRSNESLYAAKTLLEKTIELDAEFALAHVELAEVYHLLISYAGADREENNKQAKYHLEIGLKLDPNLAEGHALQGNLQMDSGQYALAQMSFDKAIALNPNFDRAYHWNSILAKWYEKDIDKACRLIQKAIELSPLDPSIIVNAGLCQMEQGNLDEAIRIVKKGIAIESAYPDNWSVLSAFYMNSNQLDSAAINLLPGIEKNGKKGNYFAAYAGALYRLKLYDILQGEIEGFEPTNDQDRAIKKSLASATNLDVTKDLAYALEYYKPDASIDNSDNGGLSWALYQGRDWANVVKYYEKGYGDMEDFNELLNVPFLYKVATFNRYVYALHRLGEADKAEDIWAKLGKPIMEKHGLVNSITMQRQLNYIRLRNFAIQKNKKGLLSLLNEIYEKHWAWLVDIVDDPLMDLVIEMPEFISIRDEVNLKLAVQQKTVRNYLKVKG